MTVRDWVGVAETNEEITRLLRRWRRGDAEALEELVPLVYDELRTAAQRHLRQERADHTLQPTALVHETYLRLADGSQPEWQSRMHFFAVAARVMRQVLVDHARLHKAAKRGGGAPTLSLEEGADRVAEPELEILALNEALERLEEFDPLQAKVIDLRFFAGMSLEETAAVVERSVPWVVREARAARAWLYDRMTDGDGEDPR